MTRAEIQTLFTAVLAEAGLAHWKIMVNPSSANDPLLSSWSVRWKRDEFIELRYHPQSLQGVPSPEDVRLMLKHEVCHPLTIPSVEVEMALADHAPATLKAAYLNYVDLFREYLAHVEFCRRFASDREAYTSRAKKRFQPDRVLADMRADFKTAPEDAAWVFFLHSLRIFYDAIYFHVAGDDHFQKWAREREAGVFYQIFRFVMEDIGYINSQTADYGGKMQMMGHSFWMFANIEVESVFAGRLWLVQHVDKLAEKLNPSPGLLALWHERELPVVAPL